MARKKKGMPRKRTGRQGATFPYFGKISDIRLAVLLFIGIVLTLFIIGMILFWLIPGKGQVTRKGSGSLVQSNSEKGGKPAIKEEFLTVSPYNRPGRALDEINGVVIHYVMNPGSTAEDNRNYFENLSKTKERKASSHFIIGLEGEIIQLIPLDEIAYCSNDANKDTISIECCHPDKSGKFNEKTYESAVKLTAWLCSKYQLDTDQVIRHYDVTGKKCPLYYVKHPDAWDQFKKDVEERY